MSWIKEEFAKLDINRKTLSNFGFLFCVVFILLAGVYWYKNRVFNVGMLSVAAVFAILGAGCPRLLLWPYKAWMLLAFVLNFFVMRILLGVFFYLVITPVAVLMRVCGKRPLAVKPDPACDSYWEKVPQTPKERYLNQF